MPENTFILPTYNASPEQNSIYIRRMLPLMLKHNVPVDPINYAVWYHYVAGTSGDLNMAIDTLIRDQNPFDAKTSLNLYKTYVCNASVEFFEKINSNLQRLITQTTFSVNATSEKASAAGDTLNVKLKVLRTVENEANLKFIEENLKSIFSGQATSEKASAAGDNFNDKLKESRTVENEENLIFFLLGIILETTQLAEASKTLINQLDNTNKEMEQLRNELIHVREAANTDGLTGLLNRWAFDQALGELVENATTKNACLAILEIDHFKRINDSFGHLVGDKVIKYFAALLKKHTAEHHHVARYGKGEMAIIMADTTLTAAFNLTEQIRKTLDKSQFKPKGDTGAPGKNTGTLGKVTLSAGIALLQAVDTAYTFTERAEIALYRAKETGRNKVVTENTLNP